MDRNTTPGWKHSYGQISRLFIVKTILAVDTVTVRHVPGQNTMIAGISGIRFKLMSGNVLCMITDDRLFYGSAFSDAAAFLHRNCQRISALFPVNFRKSIVLSVRFTPLLCCISPSITRCKKWLLPLVFSPIPRDHPITDKKHRLPSVPAASNAPISSISATNTSL